MHFVSILLSLALTTLQLQAKESTATYIKCTLFYYIIIIYFSFIYRIINVLSCFVVVVLDLKYLLIISYRIMHNQSINVARLSRIITVTVTVKVTIKSITLYKNNNNNNINNSVQ